MRSAAIHGERGERGEDVVTIDREMLCRTLEAHDPLARVVVASHAGSVPRDAGAEMLVWPTGQTGTIGGGALEYAAAAAARDLLCGTEDHRLMQFPLGPSLGQCCGGAVTLVIERITDVTEIPDVGLYIRPVSRGAGPAPTIRGDGGSACPGQGAELRDGWLIEPLRRARDSLWIWGAGHVGRAIVEATRDLDFAVTWIDIARDRFPEASPEHVDMLVAAKPAEVVRYAPGAAHHLVLTHSHALDLDLCHQILSTRFGTLGLIGSATKYARFSKRLRDMGHGPDLLARLTCPIGDPALGKEPRAIAIGVVHALLRRRHSERSADLAEGRVA